MSINALTSSHLSILLYLAGSLLQSAFYWLLTVYVSRVFGLSELGEVSYSMAIVTPLSILGALQLRSYYVTTKEANQKGQIKWLRLLSPTVLLGFSAVIIHFFSLGNFLYFIFFALLKWGELLSDLSYAFWQKDGGLPKLNRSIFFRFILLGIIVLVCWISNTTLVQSLTLLALTSIAISVLDYFKSPVHETPIEIAGSRKILKTTLSLSISALLTALLINIPRYLLNSYQSSEDLGLFSILFYYYVIPSMFVNFTCQGALDKFQSINHRVLYGRIILGLALVSLAYGLMLLIFGEQITRLLYGANYPLNLATVCLIIISFLLGGIASLLHYTLMSQNIYHVQFWTNIASAIVTFLVGLLLIPQMNVLGAFISFLSGLMIQSITYLYLFFRMKNG